MKQYELNGVTRNVPTGFSWTTLFFGALPALFRGDLKWAAIQIVVHFLVALATAGFGVVVTWIIFAVIYNARHEQDLKLAGWKERGASRSGWAERPPSRVPEEMANE